VCTRCSLYRSIPLCSPPVVSRLSGLTMTYTQVPPLTCNIFDLKLARGKLTGPNFFRFVQMPQPRLKRLCPNSVTGLVNKDLLAFISIIASTLEGLWTFSPDRSSPRRTAHPEYAIDLLMPRLVSLHKNPACRRPSHS